MKRPAGWISLTGIMKDGTALSMNIQPHALLLYTPPFDGADRVKGSKASIVLVTVGGWGESIAVMEDPDTIFDRLTQAQYEHALTALGDADHLER